MGKLQKLAKKIKAFEERMLIEGEETFKEAFKEFFDKHPEAKSIIWVGYTPYFNDGDACYYSLRELELRLDTSLLNDDLAAYLTDNDYDDEDESYSYGQDCAANIISDFKDRPLSKKEQSLIDDFYELSGTMQQLEDTVQMIFGDHTQVVATKKGFDVTEYEHE